MNIIRYRGTPNKATVNGKEVVRQESLWVDAEYGLVKCAPYDNHFIFENPHKREKGPAFQCTCGSIAVVTGASGYAFDGSPQGFLFICYNHATFGVHQGDSKWI